MSACSQMCSVNTSVCAKPWCMLRLCSRVNMLSIFIPSWTATHADQEIADSPKPSCYGHCEAQRTGLHPPPPPPPNLRELHWLQVHDSILCKLLSVTYSVENLPLNLSVVILLHTHLIHLDHKASHFLMFWGPSTVKQSDMASKPSDISPLPKAMPCPGDWVKQNLFFQPTLNTHFLILTLSQPLCEQLYEYVGMQAVLLPNPWDVIMHILKRKFLHGMCIENYHSAIHVIAD